MAVAQERENCRVALARFNAQLAKLEREALRHSPSAYISNIQSALTAIREGMSAMDDAAKEVFTKFEAGEIEPATKSMARMDRRLGDVHDGTATLEAHFMSIQKDLFHTQTSKAERIALVEWCIGASALLTAVLAIIYGRRLARRLAADSQEKDNYIRAVERAHDELHDSEEITRSVIDSALDAVIMIDSKGVITRWNSQAEDVFGWKREEAVGKTLSETIIPPQFRSAHEEGIKVFLQHGRGPVLNQRIEISALNRAGLEFPVELTVTPIHVGHNWLFSAFLRDISPRRKAEAELREAKELAEKTAVDAKAADKAKSEFLAMMSHEIRTPMNGVLGFIEMLESTDLNARQRHYTSIIRSSGDALLVLINDILDFSKIEAGKMDLELAEFDVRQVIQEVSELLSTKAEEAGIELAMNLPNDIPRIVRGDLIRVRQVLLNLIGNAIKFTKKGFVLLSVSIEPGSESSMLRISVKDSGIGIPEEKQGQLFQRFTQADSSTTRRFGGTGLGLAISKRLVELMGGSIGLESKPQLGSTFWFTLPVAGRDLQIPPQSVPVEISHARILIADSHQLSRNILCDLLKSWRLDYAAYGTGEEAFEAAAEAINAGNPFHLACIDNDLPDRSPSDLAKQLAGLSFINNRSQIGTLLIASPRGKLNRDTLLENGFTGWISRPLVRPSEFMDALAQAWAAHHPICQPEPPREDARKSIEPSSDAERMTVLLAEDNATNQLLATAFLQKLGCEVETADSGRTAVTMATTKKYSLILMDCWMPELDGFQATQEIRKYPLNRSTPIVAVTANAMAGDREKCISAGMDDYLSKPLCLADLKRVLSDRCVNGARVNRHGSVSPFDE